VRNGIDDPSCRLPIRLLTDRPLERIVPVRIPTAACGISRDNPPTMAETLPPKDAAAVRTIAVDGARPNRLPDWRNTLRAAAHGRLAVYLPDVCDAYALTTSSCSTYGPIQDRAGSSWLAGHRHSGGRPAGCVRRCAGPDTLAGLTTPHPDRRPCDGHRAAAAYRAGEVPLRRPTRWRRVAKYLPVGGASPSTSAGDRPRLSCALGRSSLLVDMPERRACEDRHGKGGLNCSSAGHTQLMRCN